MSRESFGRVCDQWRIEHPFFEPEWTYRLEDAHFVLSMKDGDETKAKADIPNGPDLNGMVVSFVLSVLKAQIDLYNQYGIKI